jgi:hypothetical protein
MNFIILRQGMFRSAGGQSSTKGTLALTLTLIALSA